jgi:CPA2 family monovalent cation:H+ antiporter-2
MHGLLPIIISAVAVATLLNVLLKRIGIPTVIGYIFTGVIIGSIFGVDLHASEQLEHIAEFGIVFLMFTIGLEFSFAHLKSMKKEVFLLGALQVFVTGSVLTLISELVFDIGYKSAVLVGLALALSSTAIVLKLLNESGKIKAPFGKNSLGILIFQDMAVIPILLMVTIFTDTSRSVSELLIDTSINAAIALTILIVLGKFALKHVFKIVSSTNSKEIYMGSILFTVVGASFVAHHFGFSYSLGGFIAGMMIADTIYKYQVEADLIPFRDLLLGVFFVTVGLQIKPDIVVNNIHWILLLGLSIMLLKTLCLSLILFFVNDKKTSLMTAITLSEIGEFALVVFSLLLTHNMLSSILVQIFMITVVMSMVATPFLLNNAEKLVDFIFKRKVIDSSTAESGTTGGRVILCGYGTFGRAISSKLEETGINHIIITENTDAYVSAKEEGKNIVYGDASDRVLLEDLKIKEALSTVIAIENLEKVKLVMASITLIDPEIKVISRVSNEEEKSGLSEFNNEFIIDGNSYTAGLLVDKISKARLLAQETSTLKYLDDYSIDEPELAIDLIKMEQARLLDIISNSFNGLREQKEILIIKAFHDSFTVLNEIVGNAISDIMGNAKLSSSAYERISTLLDNQNLLVTINTLLISLGKELKKLGDVEETRSLSQMAVEGLDAVLLSLKDIATNYNKEDMMILKNITSAEGGGIAKIRQSYLGSQKHLNQETKSILLSSTSNMERLKQLFGDVGNNYKKLSIIGKSDDG